ncbi:MAG TPA: hypothetical protein VD902_01620 [Symbiobacteriaceae bacterium]|nr:hypothetical protein [Symbiobacteriaceae bacterium]
MRLLLVMTMLIALAGCGRPADVDPRPEAPAAQVPPAAPNSGEAIGAWSGGTLYLDVAPAMATVTHVAAGGKGRAITAVPYAGERPQIWTHLHGDQLWLIVPVDDLAAPGRLYRIDLAEGSLPIVPGQPTVLVQPADMGPLAVVPSFRVEYRVSPDQRYLAWRLGWTAMPTEIIDLQTGERRPIEGEAHVTGLQWSPVENLLAVRAAEPGSGLPVPIGAMYLDGATHVDVIDSQGQVLHLHPPEPLRLVEGPFWSPDGRSLTVTSGIVEAVRPEIGSRFESTDLWSIDVESGRWTRVGPYAGK